jgi:hypothetical protein
MRIAIPLVIDMTDEQVEQYAAEYGLPASNGKVRARDVVDDVRSYVLTCVQDSAAFGETGTGDGTRGADVTIKR